MVKGIHSQYATLLLLIIALIGSTLPQWLDTSFTNTFTFKPTFVTLPNFAIEFNFYNHVFFSKTGLKTFFSRSGAPMLGGKRPRVGREASSRIPTTWGFDILIFFFFWNMGNLFCSLCFFVLQEGPRSRCEESQVGAQERICDVSLFIWSEPWPFNCKAAEY